MAKKKVFISYRRDDAAGFSHAIHDRLVEHLSKDGYSWMYLAKSLEPTLFSAWIQLSGSAMFCLH
jgi:hypothetical protein